MVQYEIPLRVATGLILLIGITANILSLCYFIKRQNKRLGNRLLMLLNTCDLVVCLSTLTNSTLLFANAQNSAGALHTIYLVNGFIYALSIDCTGFSTCLISITRTIKVCRPFYRIKGKLTAASFVVYFICSFTNLFICYYGIFVNKSRNSNISYYVIYYPLIVSLGIFLSVLSVFVSTVVTAIWLMKKKIANGNNLASNHYATITILILSTIFCLLNIIFVSVAILSFCVNLKVIEATDKLSAYANTAFAITICLNSTVNPIIYLTRKKAMRQFVLEVWRTVKDKLSRSQAEPEVDVLELTIRNLVIINNPTMPLYNHPDNVMIDNEMV